MKVVVYGICKDESQFVDRWMDSMEEADQVVVLDTGSQDDTVEKLRRRGAVVEQEIIQPWRFDTARNRSMALIPADADVCVCTDLDEAFHPGWRAALERAWTPDATQGRYRYTWSFQPDGREGVVFYTEKIHRNGGFRWVGPVHEVLRYQGSQREKIITLPGVQLDHRADPQKSRSQYLPLLELAVAEEPENDRSAHYLGREYMFHGMWRKSIAQLQRHLTLKSARWADERCASMRYIARDYVALEDKAQALVWLLRAAAEAPYLREPWVELGHLLYSLKDWAGVCFAIDRALAITQRPTSYVCEEKPWGSLPYDLRSVARYHLGLVEQAYQDAVAAQALDPQDQRIQGNVRLLAEKTGRTG